MPKWLSHAFWIAVFLCALVGFGALVLNASRHPPTHQQSERSRKAQDGTQFVPPIASEAPPNEGHSNQTDGARRGEKRKPSESAGDWLGHFVEFNITDLLLALFTGVLAGKTGGLFRETAALRAAANQQARDMEASILEARRSADAANLNAKAVIESERARLFVVINDQNIFAVFRRMDGATIPPNMLDGSTPRLFISYSFKNFGKTPAIIRAISEGSIVAPDFPENNRTHRAIVDLPAHILGADDQTPLTEAIDLPQLTPRQVLSINGAEATFWFYGFITYDDTFGWRRTLNFVWHYGADSNGFRLFRWHETEERRPDEG